jgi:hypothetical protein
MKDALTECESEIDVLLSQLPKEPMDRVWVEKMIALKETLRIELGTLKARLWAVYLRVSWTG